MSGTLTAGTFAPSNIVTTDIDTNTLDVSQSLTVSNGASVNMGGNVVRNVGRGDISSASSTDAVNGGQLFESQAAAFGYTDREINSLEDRQNKGLASSLAFAGLKYSTVPGKFSVGLAGGTWSGETGYALGVNYTTVDGKFGFNSAFGGNSDEQGGNLGVSFLIN